MRRGCAERARGCAERARAHTLFSAPMETSRASECGRKATACGGADVGKQPTHASDRISTVEMKPAPQPAASQFSASSSARQPHHRLGALSRTGASGAARAADCDVIGGSDGLSTCAHTALRTSHSRIVESSDPVTSCPWRRLSPRQWIMSVWPE
eukprot:6182210-Pleurochrysis_carterae.AAC.2